MEVSELRAHVNCVAGVGALLSTMDENEVIEGAHARAIGALLKQLTDLLHNHVNEYDELLVQIRKK